MKNLVSKNPVLRFKLGKKIIKAFKGYRMNSSGLWLFIDDTPTRERKTYSSDIRNITPEKIVPLKDGRTIAKINGKWYNQNGLKVINFGSSVPNPTGERTITKISTPGKGTETRTGKGTTYQDKGFMGVKRGGNVTNFNDAIKNSLKAKLIASGSFTDADFVNTTTFLNALNRYFGKDNYGSVVADGMWGNLTQRAFDEAMKKINAPVVNTAEGIKFLGEKPRLISGIDIATKIVPKLNIPKLTPSLGYNTTNTYEDKDFYDKVSGLGIRSNDDLARFMKDTSGNNVYWNENEGWKRQFRNDINQALGGDYSDANIRKVFGTQGRWGRRGFLGRGDFGDFQSALLKYAGNWNGVYQKNLSDLWSKLKFKQGGSLLPSRNIITRFKQRNFR